jgi:hypothetical protein
MANVAGPPETIYLAGAPLEKLMFWVPALGSVGLCLSIISYAGNLWLGVATDQGLVPDPETIIAGFHTEFDTLLNLDSGNWARAMSDKLDTAIQTLDALLADQDPA